MAKSFRFALTAPLFALCLLAGCKEAEPRPEGVGRGIMFSVTPLYPHSFEITASGSRLRDGQELKDAWQRKAVMVAKGHRFSVTSPPVVHSNESDYGGGPLLTRSVTGAIAVSD